MNKASTLAQQGYDLLMLLAISDRHYHEKEARKISEFIQRHYQDYKLNVRNLEYFTELSEEKRLEMLVRNAESFEGGSENKQLMIKFVFGVIFADRKFAQEEKSRFKILERFWDFSLKEYIDKIYERSK